MKITSYWSRTEVLRDTHTATITIPDDQEILAIKADKHDLLVITRRTQETA